MALRARGKEIINSIASVSTGKLPLYKKLWENPNPTSEFAAQSITLLSDDYDFLLVIYRRTGTYTDSEGLIIPKGANATLSYANATGTGAEGRIRTMVYNSDTSYTFGEAYEASGTSARTTNNLRIVPTIIYGFKKDVDVQSVIASVSTEAKKCMMSDGVTNVEDGITEVANSVSALNTKLTPKLLYDGNVTFTNGNGWVAIGSLSNTKCMLAYAQCVGASAPCVVSLDNAGAGVFVLLPISLGYSGTLQVRIYGIGWD